MRYFRTFSKKFLVYIPTLFFILSTSIFNVKPAINIPDGTIVALKWNTTNNYLMPNTGGYVKASAPNLLTSNPYFLIGTEGEYRTFKHVLSGKYMEIFDEDNWEEYRNPVRLVNDTVTDASKWTLSGDSNNEVIITNKDNGKKLNIYNVRQKIQDAWENANWLAKAGLAHELGNIDKNNDRNGEVALVFSSSETDAKFTIETITPNIFEDGDFVSIKSKSTGEYLVFTPKDGTTYSFIKKNTNNPNSPLARTLETTFKNDYIDTFKIRKDNNGWIGFEYIKPSTTDDSEEIATLNASGNKKVWFYSDKDPKGVAYAFDQRNKPPRFLLRPIRNQKDTYTLETKYFTNRYVAAISTDNKNLTCNEATSRDELDTPFIIKKRTAPTAAPIKKEPVTPTGTTDDPLPKGLIEIKKLINNVDKYITIKNSNKLLSFDLSIESATTANKSRRTLFIEYDESGNKQKIFGSLNPNDYTFHNLDSFAATNENKNSKSIRQGFLSNYNNGCFQTSWYPYFGNDSIKTFNFPRTNQYLITTLRAYNTGNTNIYFGIQNGQFKIDLEPTSVDAKLTINTTSAPGADGVEGGDEDDADQLPPTITIAQVEQLLTTANTQLQATKAQDAVFTTFGKDYAIKPAFQTKFNNTKTAQTNAKNKLQELLNQETTPPATLPGTTKTSIQDLITEAATILSSVQTSVPDSSSTMPGKQHGEEKLETVQSLLQTAFDSLKTAMITIPEPPPDPQVDTDDVLLPVGFIKISHAQSQNPSLFMTISSKTISDYEYKLLMASPDGTPSTSFKQIFRVIRKKIGTKDRQKILACLDKNYSYNATAETILTNQGFLEEDYFERTHPHDWAYTTIKTLKIKDSTDKYLITTLGQYKDKATNPNIYFGYKNGQFKTDLTKNDTAAQFKIITTNKPEGATVEAGAIIIPKIDQIKSNLEKAKTATTAKNKIESLVASLTIAESVPANQITYEIQSAFFNQLNSLLTEPLLTKVKTEKQVAALRALVTKAITSNLVPINIKIIQYFEGKLPGLVVVKTDLEKMFEQFEKAKTSTTGKEKVEALVAAQAFATPKIVKQITPEKLTEIQAGLDNLVFELLTTELEKVKTDKQVAALKGVINKLIATTSKLLPIRSKVLLKLLADSTLKVTPTATPTTPAAIPAQIRGPGGLPPRRTTRGRTTTSLGGRQVGTQQRGRRVIPRR